MRCISSLVRLCVPLFVLALLSSACAVDTAVQRTSSGAAGSTGAAGVAAEPVDVEFEATTEYLARARMQTVQAASFRFEGLSEVESSLFDMGSRTTPFVTGEVDGQESHTYVDMGAFMGAMLNQLDLGIDSADLNMTIVTDADAAYLNAPFFSAFAAVDPSMSGMDWLDDIATGWGRIDLDEFDNGDLMSGIGAGSAGTEILAVLDSAAEVLDGGEADVRGVSTRVAHANVSFADLIEASGQDLEALGVGNGEASILQGLSANVAVFVDDNEMVRRVEFTMDFSALESMDPSMAGLDMVMWQQVDFFDFGADVNVDVPTEWIDITDEFGDLAG